MCTQNDLQPQNSPKTVEELEDFKSKYPDVYDVVETVSHLQSDARTKDLESQVQAMREREAAALRKEAETELFEKHPDFADIRDSDEFHAWAESQPEDIQAWVYNNPNNVIINNNNNYKTRVYVRPNNNSVNSNNSYRI